MAQRSSSSIPRRRATFMPPPHHHFVHATWPTPAYVVAYLLLHTHTRLTPRSDQADSFNAPPGLITWTLNVNRTDTTREHTRWAPAFLKAFALPRGDYALLALRAPSDSFAPRVRQA